MGLYFHNFCAKLRLFNLCRLAEGKSSRRPNGQGSSTLDSYEKPQELRTASKHVAWQII